MAGGYFYLVLHGCEDMKYPAAFVIVTVLLSLPLLLAGCSAPGPFPVGSQPTPEETLKISGSDSVFLSLYDESSDELVEKMAEVNSRFHAPATNAGRVYSPTTLRLAALDMRDTAERYHASMLALEDFSRNDNVLLRNEYLGYLTGIANAGNSITEAASAESLGQPALGINYAGLARDRLARIEGIPDEASRNGIEVMKVQLDDYIREMRKEL
jgi:hypothetical protein